MERRKDYRHGFRYMVSLKCRRTQRLVHDINTEDVSASGLSFIADDPHGFHPGDRLEVQLFARIPNARGGDLMVMASDAVVVRAEGKTAALQFDGPLVY